jgi:Flp pilus assembly protein TadG
MGRQKLSTLTRRFARDRRGHVAMIFALRSVGLIGVTGLAVDYARGSQAKSSLFFAADAAALAGARLVGTEAEREEAAKQVFEANLSQSENDLTKISMKPENIVKDGRNYGFRVTASADIPTTMSRILGFQELGVSTLAEAIGVLTTPTEVVLALDTTFSMTGWKVATLKDAATKLIDDLKPLALDPDKLKFGIVPFGQYVNIGVSNRNEPWMNVPPDSSTTTTSCKMEKQVIGSTNCQQVWVPPQPAKPPGTCYNDGVPFTCGGSAAKPGYFQTKCDPVYGPDKEVCKTTTATLKWNGCAGSRNYPLNTLDGSYGTRIPGIMNITCGTEILDLTTNSTLVKTRIQALTPNGETYIPGGLIWAWRMLSPQAPLSNAATRTSAEPVRKFLILMTDGLNTKSPNYPTHNGSNGAISNQLVKEICKNISKDTANAITIYSVAFDVSDVPTKDLLKTCALDTGGQFFDAKNAADFLAAFSKIGMNIGELRLTK